MLVVKINHLTIVQFKARSPFVLKQHTTSLSAKMKKSGMFVYWRASVASETVLGVDNAKSGICYWRASEASETLSGATVPQFLSKNSFHWLIKSCDQL